MLSRWLAFWTLLHAITSPTSAQAQENDNVSPLVLPPLKPLPSSSFRGPFGQDSEISGFQVTGQASRIPTSPDFIRLVPPIPLAHGAVFTSQQIKAEEWIVEIALRVHGSVRTQAGSPRGGRGLGFWYTKTGSPTKQSIKASDSSNDPDSAVSFFGQSINFDGLGIILDSAPSAPLLARSDPVGWRFGADATNVISALIDDGKTGSKWYDNYKTGQKRASEQEALYLEKVAGECEAAFRNAPGLVWVRISHFNKEIRVDLDLQPHTTLSQEKRNFNHHCLTVKDVQLPTGYHFGLSALASGNTEPDSVDVYAFESWEVTGKADKTGQAKQPPVNQGKEGDSSPLAGTLEDLDDPAIMFQEILAAQARMTEAIDALARRLDNVVSQGGGSSDGRVQGQLNEMHTLISRLADGRSSKPGEAQPEPLVSAQLDKMSTDIKALNAKVDTLTSRMNKSLGTISSRSGEIFTLVNRLLEGDAQKLASAAASNIGERLWKAFIYVAGLGVVGTLGVLANNWRKNRSEGGGRGKKMI